MVQILVMITAPRVWHRGNCGSEEIKEQGWSIDRNIWSHHLKYYIHCKRDIDFSSKAGHITIFYVFFIFYNPLRWDSRPQWWGKLMPHCPVLTTTSHAKVPAAPLRSSAVAHTASFWDPVAFLHTTAPCPCLSSFSLPSVSAVRHTRMAPKGWPHPSLTQSPVESPQARN